MIQEIAHSGWKRNLRIQGPTTELIITLDVGPRILHYAFHDAPNVFVKIPAQLGGSGENEWMIRGGHRFWTAPEADHSYDLDNGPVTYKKLEEASVEIIQPVSAFGFQKSLRVELLKDEVVRVTHILTNVGKKSLDYTPWALSVMAAGGTAFIPQPKLDLHPSQFPEGRQTEPQDFLPNRELILWPYTNLADGRFSFSEHFLRVKQDTEKPPTKIGLKFPTGWVAYQNGDSVFAKHFSYDPAQPYTDRGVNFELFTNSEILELETIAPLLPLAPGATHEHTEHWILRKADLKDETAAQSFFKSLPAL